MRFGARARNIKNAPKVNKEYTVPELLRLLGEADEKIEKLETQIAALSSQIRDLGGEVMDDKALEKFGQEIAAKKAAEEKRELEMRMREAEI